MDDRWSWAETAWSTHFQPLRDAGLVLERIAEPKDYWDLHERELRKHFPPEVFFDLQGLRTPEAAAAQQRINSLRGGSRLADFCVARDQTGAIAAMFCGIDKGEGMYRMWHTNVHPDHRRRGLYRAILDATIGYTRELGFDSIVSEHAPGNNAILIAKLRAGFRIVSLEIDPRVGMSIYVRYFHNPDHLAAYELRCGLATLTPGLHAHGTGAYSTLARQFRGDPES